MQLELFFLLSINTTSSSKFLTVVTPFPTIQKFNLIGKIAFILINKLAQTYLLHAIMGKLLVHFLVIILISNEKTLTRNKILDQRRFNAIVRLPQIRVFT